MFPPFLWSNRQFSLWERTRLTAGSFPGAESPGKSCPGTEGRSILPTAVKNLLLYLAPAAFR
ncbi:hypothetical protein HMPREF1548_01211 [Clostridium sp. KLE 1755]|nr:hypothetical protein HMPREF1548_01211 [Clostridium sp. KLE 1755]